MSHQHDHDRSHRQEREHKKEEQKHSTSGEYLPSVHPAWYVVVGVIAIGAAVLIWTFVYW
jgi:hypothetical protein